MDKTFNLVIPAYNEEKIIEKNLIKTYDFLTDHYPRNLWTLTLSNNASTDNTGDIGRQIAKDYPNLKVIDVPQRGKGFAVYTAWDQSDKDILVYTDADLSVELDDLITLIKNINDEYPIVIGSRLIAESKVNRHINREISSRVYNFFTRLYLKLPVHDAQCGFKAIARDVFSELYPQTQERGWFFDTELLYLATKKGYKIKEIPVTWQETRKSKIVLTKDVPAAIKLIKQVKSRNAQ